MRQTDLKVLEVQNLLVIRKTFEHLFYRIGHKLRDLGLESRAKVPGPGNYDVRQQVVFPKAAGVKFGNASRLYIEDLEKKSAAAPGPGAYTQQALLFKEKGPNYRFSSASRSVMDKRGVPGPGSYQLKGLMGKDGPVHSIYQTIDASPQLKLEKNSPGPGSYSPNKENVLRSAGAYKMGSEKKLTDHILEQNRKLTVGPGAYENTS